MTKIETGGDDPERHGRVGLDLHRAGTAPQDARYHVADLAGKPPPVLGPDVVEDLPLPELEVRIERPAGGAWRRPEAVAEQVDAGPERREFLPVSIGW